MLTIRPVAVGDYEAYVGKPLPYHWCDGTLRGFVADRDGDVVALGILTRSRTGIVWAWYNAKEQLSAVALHRRARRTLNVARDELRAEAVWAFPDRALITAEKWLTRLGFKPCDGLACHPSGEYRTVWKCAL